MKLKNYFILAGLFCFSCTVKASNMGSLGLLSGGVRNMDGGYLTYTLPQDYSKRDGLGVFGPQLGLASTIRPDFYVGYGVFAAYMLSIGWSAGLRYSEEQKLRAHFQYGMGFFAYLTVGATSNFKDNHQIHFGIEGNLPL